MSNAVVNTIIKVVDADIKRYMEGKVQWGDDKKPKLQERGGVYGIAVKLDDNEVKGFFYEQKDKKKNLELEDWKPLEWKGSEKYYPLYWGKDINLGFRLFEHMKSSKTIASIQLDSKIDLCGRDVIYGAVFCNNNAKNERRLHEEYPDIYKTNKLK